MTLTAIEKAIKPQFTWAQHPTKRLQTYSDNGRERGLGRIIFIGIATSYGISPSEIADFLNIGSPEYKYKLKIFQSHWDIVLVRKAEATICIKHDLVDKVYRKTRLTLNALNFAHKDTLHHTLKI